MAEDFGVQAEFVAEGVVDGGNIGAGAAADFADGGFVETLVGENFGCGVEEFFADGACVGRRDGWGAGRGVRRVKRWVI